LSQPPKPLSLDTGASSVAFWIHVTPRTKRPAIGGLHGDALRVAVTAPPLAGKANAACRGAIAEAIECPRGDVYIDPTSKGRRKRVKIDGDPKILAPRLIALAHERRVG